MPRYNAGELGSPGVVVTVNYGPGSEGFGHLPGVAEAHARAGGRTSAASGGRIRR
jgi:hypothetical protein